MKPILIINFKIYKESTGNNALELAKIAEKVAKEENIEIALAVNAIDLQKIKENVEIPVYAQHVDGVELGANTGFISVEMIKAFDGTLLNHSEHKLDFEVLKQTIERCKNQEIKTIVCAATPEEAGKISELNPDFIAIEPPELIGGDISVSKAQPEIITNTLEKVQVPVITGAGIKTKEDIKIAIELGTKGVLVASGITKAKDPESILKYFAESLK
jgi:triosephosphate isomerase